ncbi:MAG: class I SAM-dependent DNA methyltransferase [Brevinematia bacterium]
MKSFGNLYSKYYDLLYKDKDYKREVDYIETLIKENISFATNILDFGCGTGRHAELLCERGYMVHGIDISEDMIKVAKGRIKGKEGRLYFTCGNVEEMKLDGSFDVVISLFHVLSYQNSNKQLENVFDFVRNVLKDNGIFIFDFWYGPAVLTDRPTIRIKRLEENDIKITRIAEPVLYPQKNLVEVNYEIFIENKLTGEVENLKEIHNMRYFFDLELEYMLEKTGFSVIKKLKWLSLKDEPDFQTWYVVWVVKKI